MARAWRPLLAACAVTLAGGAAQAGEHVDWLDDGTVLLKLGPAYDNAVIETSRDSWAPCSPGRTRTRSPARRCAS